MICAGTGCVANGSLKVKDALDKELVKRNLQNEVKVVLTGCNGFCAKGPVIVVYPEDIFYQQVKAEDVPYLVEEHFVKGRPVQKFLYTPPAKKDTIPVMNEIPFFKHQVLRALRNRSLIDAEKIEEYIARDGYMAAVKALTEMTPEQIVSEMKRSGLRGRGGAGFLTGLKWELCLRVKGDIKYILCNGDEGDPGAFMDRSVMEADPHSVLEGMIIAAKAIDAHYGYIYVRAEYPLAVHRLQLAIDQAKDRGLLGKDILGTGFDLDIEIYQGAGAFVCGEETALMASIEGLRGMPRPKPPFPVYKGLFQRPSVLNNVETFANVPPIILHGADWFASLGTEKSKGTKVFALSGALNNIGLVEVPMGIPLKTIIYDIGGGIKGNRKFKAVQMGGPSGGCIPESLIDTPVDYENITKTGAIMGSGGMVVMDETTCMPAMAKFFLEFTEDESCGKCVPCRMGSQKLVEMIKSWTEGRAGEHDLQLLKELSDAMRLTSICGLGMVVPAPIVSVLTHFREVVDDHVLRRRCPAGVCFTESARRA
jgi:NADH:ubiquinone oxidoreductase subunit F (NADH-binding)/(2Fe-2S) ferredoxin